jgi:carbon monoxide dehydrogenase subunit G
MEMKGERLLPVDVDTAWRELNDTEALKAAVPGCESLTVTGEGAYDVAVNAAIGPVKARFKGKLQLTDLDPPRAYTVKFDLQGGMAGFSHGQARVALTAVAARATQMNYEVQAAIGGKLAQIGSRLVDAGAATMADKFFASFAAQLAAKYPPPADAPVTAAPPTPAPAPGFFATLRAFLQRLFGGKS